MKVKVKKVKCQRCHWEWNPRKEDVRECPNCHSALWDTPRENVEQRGEVENEHSNKRPA